MRRRSRQRSLRTTTPTHRCGQAIGRSLNVTFGPLDEQQVRTAFTPEDYRRLTELKAQHDPHVLFHGKHAILR